MLAAGVDIGVIASTVDKDVEIDSSQLIIEVSFDTLNGFSEPIAFAPGAQFCIHKNDILKHPLHKYELLYNQLLYDQVDAWQLERMWELLLIKDVK